MPDTMQSTRPLYQIAAEIKQAWRDEGVYNRRPVPNFVAWSTPYVDAMQSLHSVQDDYYADSAMSVVAYALSNLQGWRGDTAKRIKAELNAAIKAR